MVLNVSPYVNHKIKYSKETIWLKLENTNIRIFVVIYMYISNLIITATCCFPVKLIQHAVSTFKHYWKWRGGAGVTCRTEQSWESMRRRFTIYSIFLDIKEIDFLYQEIHPISWYQNFIFWFKEIHFLISKNRLIGLIFLNQEIGLIFLYQNQEMDFLYQKSISDITKYRINSKTAPQRAVLLFIRFFYSWYEKISIWVFDIKYQLDFKSKFPFFI